MAYYFNDIEGCSYIESPLAEGPRSVGTDGSKDDQYERNETNREEGNNAKDTATHNQHDAKLYDEKGNANQYDITYNL